MKKARYQRGFSLVEALIALSVLVVGGLGTLQLLDVMSRSTGNVSAEAEAVSLARQLRQEMENQQMLTNDLTFGAAWAAGPHSTPAGGAIQTVGVINTPGSPGRFRVDYTTALWSVDIDGDGVLDPAGVDVTIVVDNANYVRTSATETRARLLRPVVLSFRKEVQNSFAATTGGALRW